MCNQYYNHHFFILQIIIIIIILIIIFIIKLYTYIQVQAGQAGQAQQAYSTFMMLSTFLFPKLFINCTNDIVFNIYLDKFRDILSKNNKLKNGRINYIRYKKIYGYSSSRRKGRFRYNIIYIYIYISIYSSCMHN